MKSVIALAFIAVVAAGPLVVETDSLPIATLFDRYYKDFVGRDPAGQYEGTKTILGQTIKADVTFEAGNTVRFTVSGAVAIDCDKVAYTYSAPNLVLDQSNKCIHDAESQLNVEILGSTYDAAADTITAKLKYSVLTITIVLSHKAVDEVEAEPLDHYVLPMPVLFDRYYNVFMQANPAGKYQATKTVLGQTVTCTIVIASSSVFSFEVTGPVSISCLSEEYVYDPSTGTITLPKLSDPNDCLNKTLASQGVKLNSFSYDAAADVIHVSVKYSILTINLDLTHQGVIIRRRQD